MFFDRIHATAARATVRAIALALMLVAGGGAAADEFSLGGSGSTLGTMKLLAAEFTARNPDVRIAFVPSLGSAGSIKAAAAGAIGLAATSRQLNEAERRLGTVETEYARTPFVFAVSAKSAVAAIRSAELADIYAGKTVSWADGSPVRIVLRPTSDVDSEMVRSVAPELQRALAAAEARPGVRFAVTDQDAADDLERIRGAIGPSSLSLIASERRALRALRLDGREPTPANAASGAYPYHKRMFLVTGARPAPTVERFIAFVRSPAGRKILESNGQWIP